MMWSRPRCAGVGGGRGGGAARLLADGINLVAGRAGGARILPGEWRMADGGWGPKHGRPMLDSSLGMLAASFCGRGLGACVSSGPLIFPALLPSRHPEP